MHLTKHEFDAITHRLEWWRWLHTVNLWATMAIVITLASLAVIWIDFRLFWIATGTMLSGLVANQIILKKMRELHRRRIMQ